MTKRFSRKVVDAINDASIMGIKAGPDHRFIGVWPVVVNGRIYARSWGVSPDGWFHQFLEHGRGAIQVSDRQIPVRAVPARGERVRDKVEDAYAQKFTTKASQKWVRGFKTARRRAATVEFVPR